MTEETKIISIVPDIPDEKLAKNYPMDDGSGGAPSVADLLPEALRGIFSAEIVLQDVFEDPKPKTP